MSQDDRTPHDGSNSTVATPVMLCIPCVPRRYNTCEEEDCEKYPIFNWEGETRGVFCKLHKDPAMVDVKNKKCERKGCKKRPTFNFKGETRPKYCADHRDKVMVDVISKRCQGKDCEILNPSFNFAGKPRGIYCFDHKDPAMINVVSRRCERKGCEILNPNFNFPDKPRGRFCFNHKANGMVDVVSPRCEAKNCDKQPRFNIVGETRGRYCGTHKANGMIDMFSPTCEYEGCNTRPHFNFVWETYGRYCARHKHPIMVDVVHKKCEFEGCDTQPKFNIEGTSSGKFCSLHKGPTMIDVVSRRCLTEHCMTLANRPQYRGYCFPCFINTFPDEPVARNYKTKERAVVESIMQHHPDVTWIHDRRIQDGCSRRRPDLLADFGEFVICIEVDENKHEGYSCENRRIMEISQDIGHRPLIILRFNPDAYVSGGVHHTSCWKPNGNGILTIPKTKTAEWNTRLTTLNDTIRTWIGTKTDKTVEIVELFYDD